MEIDNKVVEKDLRRLEQLIDMVNFEYNLFFKGDADRPPLMNEDLLKGIINKYRVYQITDSSLRNKYNNLVSKYYSYKSRWKKYKGVIKDEHNHMEQIGFKIMQKLKDIGVKNEEQLKVLIYNKLSGLVDKGLNINDFDIIVKDNKIEVKIN
jgi:hypothetical protein